MFTTVQTIESVISAIAVILVLGIPVVIMAVRKIDKALMARQKTWEKFNETSLLRRLGEMSATAEQATTESISNQQRMRKNQHDLNVSLNRVVLENESLRIDMAELRGDFMKLLSELKQTDIQLHQANTNLLEANRLLTTTSMQLHQVQIELQKSQSERDILMEKVRSLDEIADLSPDRSRGGTGASAGQDGSGRT